MNNDSGDALPATSVKDRQGGEEQKPPPLVDKQKVKVEKPPGQVSSDSAQHRESQPEYEVGETKAEMEEVRQNLIKELQQLRPSMTETEFQSWLLRQSVPTVELFRLTAAEALSFALKAAPVAKPPRSDNPKKIMREPLVKPAKFHRISVLSEFPPPTRRKDTRTEEEKKRPALIAPKKLWKYPWELLENYWEDYISSVERGGCQRPLESEFFGQDRTYIWLSTY